jgi:hypothetical protein
VNDVETAWVAGLIEGEGFISSARGVYMGVNMTDLDVLEKLRTITGVGFIKPRKRYAERHKPQWQWMVSSQPEAQEIMRAIYPHMGQRRREQMDAALARRLKRLPGWRKTQDGVIVTETIEVPCENPACQQMTRRTASQRRTLKHAFCDRACYDEARQIGRMTA